MNESLNHYMAQLLSGRDFNEKIAKNILDEFLSSKRFNSRDRRIFGDMFYNCIRYYGIFQKDPKNFSLEYAEKVVFQEAWSEEFLMDVAGFDEFVSGIVFNNLPSKKHFLNYLKRAPLTIRVNSFKTTRDFLKYRYPDFEFTDVSPFGLKTYEHMNVRQLSEFKKGFFEIQDEASQLVYFLADPKGGEKILDFCAGSGGKSLALSSTKSGADIFAYDKSRSRLNTLKQRGKILGEDIKILNRPSGIYDKILIDAPCSGSGSLRRDSDVLLRLNEQKFKTLIATQRKIFHEAFKLTAKGSRIIYITCSFFREENEEQAEYFMENYPVRLLPVKDILDENIIKSLNLSNHLKTSPENYEMDGFFGAVFTVL